VAVREGLARLHVTLRPFEECVRQLRGFRDSCRAVPLGITTTFDTVNPAGQARTVTTAIAPPPFESLQLITYGAIVDGELRRGLLRDPFEALYREVQTFSFDEPLKYAVGTRGAADTITVQLPLEANHPLEEIVWFVRRKGAAQNNAWTNYTACLEAEWDEARAAQPLLRRAAVQANGTTLCEADEQYFRQLAAQHHRGGYAAYAGFVYGYPFARHPGQYQPSGTLNASRLNTLRLVLDVRPPGGVHDGAWEVKVFCVAINWMRYENGLANPMFED
jgi:hypothetical protein